MVAVVAHKWFCRRAPVLVECVSVSLAVALSALFQTRADWIPILGFTSVATLFGLIFMMQSAVFVGATSIPGRASVLLDTSVRVDVSVIPRLARTAARIRARVAQERRARLVEHRALNALRLFQILVELPPACAPNCPISLFLLAMSERRARVTGAAVTRGETVAWTAARLQTLASAV